MSVKHHIFSANELLASLPAEDQAYLLTISRQEYAGSGRLLRRGDEFDGDLWFPLTAVVALTTTDDQGRTVHSGLVGREGCIGAEALFTPRISMPDALVQLAGACSVIPSLRLAAVLAQRPAILPALLRSIHALSRQSMLNVTCNRVHSLTARCCRWLLAMRDQTASSDLEITQESLSLLLGSGRPRVNNLLGHLHQSGFIARSRGRIRLLAPAALLALSCDCYGVARAERM